MKRLIIWLMLSVILVLSACSNESTMSQAEYSKKATEQLTVLHDMVRNLGYDYDDKASMKSSVNQWKDKTNQLEREFNKLTPPDKLKADHINLLKLYDLFESFCDDTLSYVDTGKQSYQDKANGEIQEFLRVWNDSSLTKGIK